MQKYEKNRKDRSSFRKTDSFTMIMTYKVATKCVSPHPNGSNTVRQHPHHCNEESTNDNGSRSFALCIL